MKSVVATDGVLPVLFRKLKPFRGDPGGEIEAWFPTEPDAEFQRRLGANDVRMFVAGFHPHEGHISGDLRIVIGRSIPATSREYGPIKKALEKRGYKLRVYERTPPGAREAFQASLHGTSAVSTTSALLHRHRAASARRLRAG